MSNIYAPKAGFISKIGFQEGAPVGPGDVVIQMDEDEEDILADKHAMVMLTLAQARLRVSDDYRRLFTEAQMAKQAANVSARAYRDAAKTQTDEEVALNLTSDYVGLFADLANDRAARDVPKGLLETEIANDLLQRAKQVLDDAESVLEAERVFIVQRRDACKLKALNAGRLNLQVFQGAYVNAGDLVASIGEA